jgi:hypothetical protein
MDDEGFTWIPDPASEGPAVIPPMVQIAAGEGEMKALAEQRLRAQIIADYQQELESLTETRTSQNEGSGLTDRRPPFF